MKFNLTRTAGLAAAVAVLAGGGLATAAVASTNSSANVVVANTQAAVPALKPAQLKYVHAYWGDPKTELGMSIYAPKGWNMVKLSTFEVKMTSSNKLWNLRVNGIPDEIPVKKAVAGKLAALHHVKGFKLIAKVDGTTKATNPAYEGVVFHHTTITYTYTDPRRGTRLVVERIGASYDTDYTDLELSAGGRPQDRAGLDAVVNTATRDYVRLP
jgi:hypothetical protein